MSNNNVLIVDNNPVFLKLIKNLLTKNGYRVWTADNSISALDIVKTVKPSIIFIDLIMPNIGGEKLCRKIRETYPQKKTIIILISALAAEQEINYSEWGFNACIAKAPFEQMSQEILSCLNQLNRSKSGTTDEPPRVKDLYPREVTRELLSIKGSLETILSSVSEGILEITNEGRILYVNPAAMSIIGKTELMLLASDFRKWFKKHDRKKLEALLGLPHSFEESEGDYLLWNGKRVSLNTTSSVEGEKKIIVMSDVTDKRLAESALKLHADFDKLIMYISTQFINLALEDLDKAITKALKRIGQFAGADRSYIFLYSETGECMDNTHEWCASGIVPQISHLKNIPLSRYPWFSESMRKLQIVYFTNTDDLPVEAKAEKIEFLRQGIRSMINIPMVSSGKLLGFVGFDIVRGEKTWSSELISLFKIVGEIFVNALTRGAAEKALRESERKYRELANLLPQIVFETDRQGILTFANRQALDFFGISSVHAKKINVFKFVIAKDRAQAMSNFENALNANSLPVLPHVYTAKSKDGTTASMMVYLDKIRHQNEVTGMRGVAVDITERKRWEDLYRSLAEKSFAGVYVLVNGKFKYLNPKFAYFTGYRPEELADLKSVSLIHPDDRKIAKTYAEDMLKGKRKSPYEFRIVTKDGRILWAVETVSPIYYEGQRAILGNLMDVTEHKTAEEQLRYLSTHDSLTDLYNRAYFEAEIKRLEQGRRFPINILMADVDYLKETNDTLGHQAGDELLQRAAIVLRKVFRKEDVVARIGGDEFAAVWTDSCQNSEAVLMRIRKALSAHNKNHPSLSLSLSIGIASGARGCLVNKLIQEADKRMYEHKAQNKSQCEIRRVSARK